MGTIRYWGIALAVMFGAGWALASEFGWVGSSAAARLGGTYGSAYLHRGGTLAFSGRSRDLVWTTGGSRRGHRAPPSVQPGRGAGLVVAGAAWEAVDAAYLARLTYPSSGLRQGGHSEVRIGTVLALRTAQGSYAKVRIVRLRGVSQARWEWVLYPAPGGGK